MAKKDKKTSKPEKTKKIKPEKIKKAKKIDTRDWTKVFSEKHMFYMKELKMTNQEINEKGKKIILRSAGLALLIPLLLLTGEAFYIALLPLVLAYILFFTEMFTIKKSFEDFDQKRHYEFLYFFQLLVPHLKQAGATRLGLFNVLQKMETRLTPKDENGEGGILKEGVNRLLIDLTNRPGNINSFKDFAKSCSGTEIAEDICVALYDWQQNSTSDKQLDRLKDSINIALDQRVEEMMNSKLDKFDFYSTRVLLSTVLLSVGILGTTIYVQIIDIFSNLGGL